MLKELLNVALTYGNLIRSKKKTVGQEEQIVYEHRTASRGRGGAVSEQRKKVKRSRIQSFWSVVKSTKSFML